MGVRHVVTMMIRRHTLTFGSFAVSFREIHRNFTRLRAEPPRHDHTDPSSNASGEIMKLNAGPIIAGAQRSAAAFALSGLLLLPTIGVVPPALADGDVRPTKSNHTARAARRRTLTPSASVFADQRVQVSSHRPREKGPLQVRFVGDGSGQRSTRLPVRLARMCNDRLISRWVRFIWCSHGHRGLF